METGAFFRDVLHIDDPELIAALARISMPLHLDKGNILIHQGEQQNDFIFLTSGVFRGYYLDADGRDITDCIGFKTGTPAMSVSVTSGISPITIEAITDCTFIRIYGDALRPLMDAHPQLIKVYNDILQTAMQVHWELKLVLSQRTALARYKWFLKKYPGPIDQISIKYIASYLGVTPVTLSRIRRTMREEE